MDRQDEPTVQPTAHLEPIPLDVLVNGVVSEGADYDDYLDGWAGGELRDGILTVWFIRTGEHSDTNQGGWGEDRKPQDYVDDEELAGNYRGASYRLVSRERLREFLLALPTLIDPRSADALLTGLFDEEGQ